MGFRVIFSVVYQYFWIILQSWSLFGVCICELINAMAESAEASVVLALLVRRRNGSIEVGTAAELLELVVIVAVIFVAVVVVVEVDKPNLTFTQLHSSSST